MIRIYHVRAYDLQETFVVGVTLNCPDDEAAIAKFRQLPLGGHRAELLRKDRIIAEREPSEGGRRANRAR